MAGTSAGAWLADLVLAVHVAIAASIVLGLLLVWLGAFAGWRWVRNPWLRAGHLAAIGYVALQAVAGRICPLTTWEDQLRGVRTERGFIERQDVGRGVQALGASTRRRSATHSTCWVCGNMSMGWTAWSR